MNEGDVCPYCLAPGCAGCKGSIPIGSDEGACAKCIALDGTCFDHQRPSLPAAAPVICGCGARAADDHSGTCPKFQTAPGELPPCGVCGLGYYDGGHADMLPPHAYKNPFQGAR